MKKRLLIIDDEIAVLEALNRTLMRSDLKLEIDRSTSIPEAINLLKKNTYDLIIADDKMSLTSGIEFFKEIQTEHPKTIRIILTGYSDLQIANDAINKGIIHYYLEKPWENDMLIATLKKSLFNI